MDGCIDCKRGFAFVKRGKAYEQDTSLYECDDHDCQYKVCRQHLHSFYTQGDYCAEHAEQHRREVEVLAAIDNAWQTSEEERKRVHALFLQKLEARYPGHPWTSKEK